MICDSFPITGNHGLESLNDEVGLKIDLKVSSKFWPSTPLSNVKALLSTGLLEGVHVHYRHDCKDLHGIIKDLGYQCGCSSCNYTKVISALEFEKHAGACTKNQNNHIFVPSGKTVYGLVKDLLNSPLELLGEVIEEKIGCQANMKCFRDWKDSFQMARLGETSTSSVESLCAPVMPRSEPRYPRSDEVGLKNSTVDEDFAPQTPSAKIDPKISKKFSPNILLVNVKGLLSTGLLEGVHVHYRQDDKELHGIIKGLGYRCGCSSCNYTKVVSALEFEKHAGTTTNNQNNHIFVPSGKTVYGLVKDKDLLNSPLGLLGEVIEEKIGCQANMKRFKDWKDSFQMARHGLGETSTSSVESLSTPVKHQSEPHYPKSFEGSARESSFDRAPIGAAIEVNVNLASSIMMSPSRMKHSVLESTLQYEKMPPENILRPSSTPSSIYLHESNASPAQKIPTQVGAKKSDTDLHRLIFMENGLPDGTELEYCLNREIVLLKGYKFGTGIMCSCCNNTICPSQFESHAGCAPSRQLYNNICTSNRIPLHEISILLSQGQKVDTYSDDDLYCTICRNGGVLAICDRCYTTFHPACLRLQCQPNGQCYCPYCGDCANFHLKLMFEVLADDFGGCDICRDYTFTLSEFNAKTTIICYQCEKEFHIGCLKHSGKFDLKEHPTEQWFCCLDCNIIHDTLRNLVFYGVMTIQEPIKRKNEVKDLNSGPLQWQILSGKHQSTEPLLTKVAAIFRDAFYPIEHRNCDLIPAMIYGKDLAGQFFHGMYCVVLTMRSVIVSAAILRIFGMDIAELPLFATPRDRQRKGYFRALLSAVEELLSHLKVKVFVLHVADNEQSMWMNKFGFVRMAKGRMDAYAKKHPMLIFKKTLALEKAVRKVESGPFTFTSSAFVKF